MLPHALVRQRLEQLHGVCRIIGNYRDGPRDHLGGKADGPVHAVILVDGSAENAVHCSEVVSSAAPETLALLDHGRAVIGYRTAARGTAASALGMR